MIAGGSLFEPHHMFMSRQLGEGENESKAENQKEDETKRHRGGADGIHFRLLSSKVIKIVRLRSLNDPE